MKEVKSTESIGTRQTKDSSSFRVVIFRFLVDLNIQCIDGDKLIIDRYCMCVGNLLRILFQFYQT